MDRIRSHKDLKVYQLSYDMAMEIFNISKSFPSEERYALTSQIRNCSRSVAANLAEAFRKRRYKRVFIAKLSDSEAEAAETKPGSILHGTANTSPRKTAKASTRNMNM